MISSVGSFGTTDNQNINGLLTLFGSRGGGCLGHFVGVHAALLGRRDPNGFSGAILGSLEAASLHEL